MFPNFASLYQIYLTMKKIILFVICLFCFTTIFAQAVESKVKYNKTDQPGINAEFLGEASLVEKVIEEDLKSKGFGKGKGVKGYTLYEGINFSEISPDKIDLYVKVERKSKKEKEKSFVTFMASKGYDNFVNSNKEPKLISALINYTNNLIPKINAGNLDAKIKEQDEIVKKEEKKQTNLIDDASDLEKKKRKIEEDIINNKKEQENQKSEVEKQRQILETLKAKRTN
jgi:hypothetical protein